MSESYLLKTYKNTNQYLRNRQQKLQTFVVRNQNQGTNNEIYEPWFQHMATLKLLKTYNNTNQYLMDRQQQELQTLFW